MSVGHSVTAVFNGVLHPFLSIPEVTPLTRLHAPATHLIAHKGLRTLTSWASLKTRKIGAWRAITREHSEPNPEPRQGRHRVARRLSRVAAKPRGKTKNILEPR